MADQSGYGDDHTKSTIGVISGPVKWTLVQQKIKTEKKKMNGVCLKLDWALLFNKKANNNDC